MAQQEDKIVVVTGIGGFVGRHVAVELLHRGYSVRGTVRSLKKAADIASAIRSTVDFRDERLAFMAADLLRDDGWNAALEGASYVMHTASPFPPRVPKDENDLIAPARDGALRVLKAAKRGGVRRVVLTSSIAAVSYGKGRAPYTEADWTDVDSPLATAYYKSKTLAERAAWDYSRDNGLELSVINPGMILGPLIGRDVGTSVGVVQNLLKGKYPAMPDLRIPIVDVRDVADAHVRAMTLPAAAGERFLIAGEAMSISQIVKHLRADFPAYAGKLPRLTLPNWLTHIASRFDASLKLIVGELGRDARISNEKARRVLNWTPRNEAEAIRASAQNLIDHGLV